MKAIRYIARNTIQEMLANKFVYLLIFLTCLVGAYEGHWFASAMQDAANAAQARSVFYTS